MWRHRQSTLGEHAATEGTRRLKRPSSPSTGLGGPTPVAGGPLVGRGVELRTGSEAVDFRRHPQAEVDLRSRLAACRKTRSGGAFSRPMGAATCRLLLLRPRHRWRSCRRRRRRGGGWLSSKSARRVAEAAPEDAAAPGEAAKRAAQPHTRQETARRGQGASRAHLNIRHSAPAELLKPEPSGCRGTRRMRCGGARRSRRARRRAPTPTSTLRSTRSAGCGRGSSSAASSRRNASIRTVGSLVARARHGDAPRGPHRGARRYGGTVERTVSVREKKAAALLDSST